MGLLDFIFGAKPEPKKGGDYRAFYDPNKGGREFVHRRVAEKKMGGRIFPGYEVHHIDGDPSNNRRSNLVTLSKDDHRHLHSLKRKLEREEGKPLWKRDRTLMRELEDEIRDIERR